MCGPNRIHRDIWRPRRLQPPKPRAEKWDKKKSVAGKKNSCVTALFLHLAKFLGHIWWGLERSEDCVSNIGWPIPARQLNINRREIYSPPSRCSGNRTSEDTDTSLSWRQILGCKCESTTLPCNWVPWSLPCLGSLPTSNTQCDWVLPCWLTFFFSSCRAQPPAPIPLPHRDCFASQCQHTKAGLASHNQEALALPAVIILTVLLSPHIICHLSHSTSPFCNQPLPSTTLGLGSRGTRISAKVRALSVSFLLPTE